MKTCPMRTTIEDKGSNLRHVQHLNTNIRLHPSATNSLTFLSKCQLTTARCVFLFVS